MFVNTPCFDFIDFSCTPYKLVVRYTNIDDTCEGMGNGGMNGE